LGVSIVLLYFEIVKVVKNLYQCLFADWGKRLYLYKNIKIMGIITEEKKNKKTSQHVPDYLVYELVGGKPIYYKGYKSVLNKTKTFEEITMDSTLQAWLKSHITIFLGNFLLANGYDITTGEQGLILSKKDKRGADIAIFKAGSITLDAHYTKVAPEVVIEIDVKADTENTTEFDYVLEKIASYHTFGVKKVIWIFSKNKKIMDATIDKTWLTQDWTEDVEVVAGLILNVSAIIDKKVQ
jgi:Uma2 family endonuclease